MADIEIKSLIINLNNLRGDLSLSDNENKVEINCGLIALIQKIISDLTKLRSTLRTSGKQLEALINDEMRQDRTYTGDTPTSNLWTKSASQEQTEAEADAGDVLNSEKLSEALISTATVNKLTSDATNITSLIDGHILGLPTKKIPDEADLNKGKSQHIDISVAGTTDRNIQNIRHGMPEPVHAAGTAEADNERSLYLSKTIGFKLGTNCYTESAIFNILADVYNLIHKLNTDGDIPDNVSKAYIV